MQHGQEKTSVIPATAQDKVILYVSNILTSPIDLHIVATENTVYTASGISTTSDIGRLALQFEVLEPTSEHCLLTRSIDVGENVNYVMQDNFNESD